MKKATTTRLEEIEKAFDAKRAKPRPTIIGWCNECTGATGATCGEKEYPSVEAAQTAHPDASIWYVQYV